MYTLGGQRHYLDYSVCPHGPCGSRNAECVRTIDNCWYVQLISALKKLNVTFKGLDQNCKYAPIDDMHVCVREFRCYSSSVWWSHKFNGPGLGFEAVCDPTNKGRMMWAEGSYPAAMHNITTF